MPLVKETHSESHVGPKSTRKASAKGKYFKIPTVEHDPQRLEKIEEYAVCIILSKAIEKLQILQHLLPELNKAQEYEPYQPMVTRMTTLQKIIPPEDQEDGNTVALKHIQKCCQMSQQTLERVVSGFKSEGMLHSLKNVLFHEHLKYYDEFILKQENLNLNNTINTLKEKINEVKENSRGTRLYLDKMTQICLQQATTTAWAQAKTLKNNTEEFLKARVKLNNYKLKEKEDNIMSVRDQSDSEVARENIINNEIINHLQTVVGTLQRKFENWTLKYSEEVDALDIALLQLRSKVEEHQEKFEVLSHQHAARQELVEGLQEESDRRDRELTTRLAQTKAAVIIQQWWRKMWLLKQKAAKHSLTKKNKKASSLKKKKK